MRGVLIVGAEGSMGKRYQAILNYLGVPFKRTDAEHAHSYVLDLARTVDGVIIATPTGTHHHYLELLQNVQAHILCEKPITRDLNALSELRKRYDKRRRAITMTYQYSVLAPRDRIGGSFYNYFRHGNDGLAWDCIQIIGLARQEPVLKEDSPIWACKINGKALNLSDMDSAYVHFVKNWMREPGMDWGEIQEIHEKTADLAKRYASG